MFRSLSRRTTVVTAAAMAAALAATAFTLTPEQTTTKPKTLSWIGIEQHDTQPKHPRVGDSWTVYLHLHDNHNGKPGNKIGEGSARCSAAHVRHDGALVQCQALLRTDAGALALSAAMDRFGKGPFTGVSAVTGGTGSYREARGEAEITRSETTVIFKISVIR
jgi:hypothetical protein